MFFFNYTSSEEKDKVIAAVSETVRSEARLIIAWSENIEAQEQLAALIRVNKKERTDEHA